MGRAQQWAAAWSAGLISSCAFAQFCPQNFDGVTAPALPSGWSSTADGAAIGWNANTTNPLSAPNAAFTADVAAVGNSYLDSPPTLVNATNSTVSFRHAYATEDGYDGGVLEISIGGGVFQDILAVGGSFVVGGYDGMIPTAQMSPIGGRRAWTGSSAGYVTTIAQLPPSALGATAVLRWRLASDQSISASGWYVDSIVCGKVNDGLASEWRFGDSYPIPILDQATTLMGGTLYSFGGVSAGTITAQSYKYDGAHWTPIGALPVALEYPYAVNDGTHIFILGGSASDGTPVNTTYRYTPQTNTYETMAPFATAAWTLAAVVVSGKIVKFGGNIAGGAQTDATEIYDIAANGWSPGAPYPLAAGFISAFTRNGYVYGAGGTGAAGASKTYRYDLAANVWDDAPIPDLPDLRWGAATIDMPNGVLLAGGYVGGNAAANLSAAAVLWNPVSNSWHAFPSLIVARARMTGAVFNRQPLVIGGRSEAGGFGGTTTVQVLDRLFGDGFETY